MTTVELYQETRNNKFHQKVRNNFDDKLKKILSHKYKGKRANFLYFLVNFAFRRKRRECRKFARLATILCSGKLRISGGARFSS